MQIWSTGALLALGLAGCGALGGLAGAGGGATGAQATAATASAEIVNAQGQRVGTATLTPADAGQVRVQLRVQGLPAGEHGLHIHEVGRCDAPDFTSAGGHLNPGNRQHGTRNPTGAHAGDLPNLAVRTDGTGEADLLTDRVTLRGTGSNSVFRTGGVAVMIHAIADDYRTEPTGNSGARIACGVVTR